MTRLPFRPAVPAALLLAAGLLCLPACGSSKPTESSPPADPPGPTGDPNTPPGPTPPATTDGVPPPPKPGTVLYPQGDTRSSSARTDSQKNLKQLAIAAHNYESAFGYLPAGIYDATGKAAGLSWRVAILPFIEQDALYKKFKLNEPWDSPHNKKLISEMPKVFAPPGGSTLIAPGYTYYRSFTGQLSVVPVPQPRGPEFAGKPIPGRTLVGITDGSSNTFFAAEAADPVIWTKPDELVVDPKKPAPKMGGIFAGGFNAVMCDGAPRFIPKDTPETTLKALMTSMGGEVVNFP